MNQKKPQAGSQPQTEAGKQQPARWLWVGGGALLMAVAAGVYIVVGPAPAPQRDHAPVLQRTPAPGPAPEGMVWIPGGELDMGSTEAHYQDAQPIHRVKVRSFWMDRTEVTNARFEAFAKATGYITVAERKPNPADFPGAPPEALVPGSLVFTPPKEDVGTQDHSAWWRYVPGASWRHPEGPGSDLAERASHPVVHIAWDDAVAYARWSGKRLATEAEWELAARGGLAGKKYVWGDEQQVSGKWMANVWQGAFPQENARHDGFLRTAPVGSYTPNGFGLADMAGNVWEWTADWYRADYYAHSPVEDPQGPADSLDPAEPGTPKRVMRGGSFLCSDRYCVRYGPGARAKGAVDTGLAHLGFRCVRGT